MLGLVIRVIVIVSVLGVRLVLFHVLVIDIVNVIVSDSTASGLSPPKQTGKHNYIRLGPKLEHRPLSHNIYR